MMKVKTCSMSEVSRDEVEVSLDVKGAKESI
jgi:hypothetical protein